MKRTLVLAAALAAFVVAAPARAITISFSPTTSIAAVGDIVDVDVILSGLDAFGEILTAYDLDVTYGSTIATATGVAFGTDLGPPADVLEEFVLSSGRIDFAAVSFLPDAALAALQGDSVVLATLSFLALSPGTAPLTFDPATIPSILIVSFGGLPVDPVTALPGEILVRGPVLTPEPSGLWLGLLGLLAARGLRRKR